MHVFFIEDNAVRDSGIALYNLATFMAFHFFFPRLTQLSDIYFHFLNTIFHHQFPLFCIYVW